MKKSKLVKTPLDELTYKVNGLAMQVQSELKVGHPEEFYHRALHQKLLDAGLRVEFEKQVEVYVDDALVGYLFIDLWVEDLLVVECKAKPHKMTNDELGQVITYLAATNSPQGLLLNFGLPRLEFHRVFPPKSVQEWQRHLYRCIWTPRGHALPPLDTITPSTPIHFSVTSSADNASPQSALQFPHEKSPAASLPPIRLQRSGALASVSPSVAELSVSHPSAYTSTGVNIDSGNRAVELMRDAVRSTYDARVLAGIGAFGGLFDASALKEMRAPVLVASTDGVGTKVKLAAQAGRYQSIGHDIVNHCINDILVQGARPLFFLDYLASSHLKPEMMAEIVRGMSEACRAAGCVLLGGETAEMPGVYRADEFDVAGTIVGVVERDAILPRSDLRVGDLLIGLRSSGPHTNGYSLIRKVFADVPLDTIFPELGAPLADALLAPHRSYLPVLHSALSASSCARAKRGARYSRAAQDTHSALKALAHITGGGFIENVPRVLPDGIGASVRLGSWQVPPLFTLIQQHGEITTDEMYRVFNMGIGMIAIVAPDDVHAFQDALGEESWVIGELVNGERKVTLR